MIERICKSCGKRFKTYPCRIKKGWGNFCSPKCRPQFYKKGHITWNKNTKGIMKSNKTSFKKGQPKPKNAYIFPKGKTHPNWKGRIMHQGYVCILNPTHPRANKKGYVRRSILTMEKIIGHYLRPKEIVHHINGIKDDDRPKNLKLFANHSIHMKFHHSLKK